MKKPNLYQLTEELISFMEQFGNCETPEQEQSFFDTLESLQVPIEEKYNNYGKLIREYELLAKAAKAEKERLDKRAKGFEGDAKRMRERLLESMNALGAHSVKTELFTLSVSETRGKLVVDDPDAVPGIYKETAEKIDNAALKAACEQGAVPGAHIEKHMSLSIR